MRQIVVALGTVAAALTGCTPDGACTLMDMDSGVGVVWRPADFGKQRDAVTVRLCVDGRCAQRPSGDPGDPVRTLSVRLPDDVGAGPVPVKLTVTAGKDGRVVVQDSRRARLAEEHPNGRSCPPTSWTASFRVHPEKGLTSPKGVKLQGTEE